MWLNCEVVVEGSPWNDGVFLGICVPPRSYKIPYSKRTVNIILTRSA